MNIQRGRLVSGGRLQIPADIRRAMGLNDGDEVGMEMVDGTLQIRRFRDVLAEVQAEFRAQLSPDESIVDDFIAERRAAAAKE